MASKLRERIQNHNVRSVKYDTLRFYELYAKSVKNGKSFKNQRTKNIKLVILLGFKK